MILVKHLSKKYLVQDSFIVIFLRILVCNHFPFENQTCINSKKNFDPLLHVTSAVIESGVLHYNFTIKNSEFIVKLQAVLF